MGRVLGRSCICSIFLRRVVRRSVGVWSLEFAEGAASAVHYESKVFCRETVSSITILIYSFELIIIGLFRASDPPNDPRENPHRYALCLFRQSTTPYHLVLPYQDQRLPLEVGLYFACCYGLGSFL